MSTDHVDVDWDQARATNRANWDDRVPIHEGAYAIDALSDPGHRSDVVREDLPALTPWLPNGSLAGLDVCHLQCHIGTDTVSLAREGARLTGVDFSPAALASAAGLASRLGLDVTWVETDVLDARAAVTGDFDVVYTSIGTICWLPDLDRWAAQVAGLLRPGGVFFIRDGHPAMYALDEEADEPRHPVPVLPGRHGPAVGRRRYLRRRRHGGEHPHLRVAASAVRDRERPARRRTAAPTARRGPDPAVAVQPPHGRDRHRLVGLAGARP